MPARRTIAIGAAAAVILGVGGVAAVSALDDPDDSVEAIHVSDATADAASPAAQGGTSQQVPGLDELSGTVTTGGDTDDGTDDHSADNTDDRTDDDRTDDDRTDDDRTDDDRTDDGGTDDDDTDDRTDDDRTDDAGSNDDRTDDDGTDDDAADAVADDLAINGVDLDFGPDDWVATAAATADFDGDGTTAALRDELAGLVGQNVTLLVRFDDDGDDADVYVVGEHTYRDVSTRAPWLPPGSADDDTLRTAAADAVGDGAEVIELDADDSGDATWEATVRAADGTEHEVRLDASGAVVDVDDDA